MIFQNRPDFPPYMQHYACLSFVLARSREIVSLKPWTVKQLVDAWMLALKEGVISNDLNNDGDLDDANEAIILSYTELFKLWDLPLRELRPDEVIWPTGLDHNNVARILPTPLDTSRYWVAEQWHHKMRHFVQGDGSGARRPIYDSIYPESQTRLHGHIQDLRVFMIDRRGL